MQEKAKKKIGWCIFVYSLDDQKYFFCALMLTCFDTDTIIGGIELVFKQQLISVFIFYRNDKCKTVTNLPERSKNYHELANDLSHLFLLHTHLLSHTDSPFFSNYI